MVSRAAYESLESQMRIQDIVIAKLQLRISEMRNDLADSRTKFKASQIRGKWRFRLGYRKNQLQIESL